MKRLRLQIKQTIQRGKKHSSNNQYRLLKLQIGGNRINSTSDADDYDDK